MISRLIIFFILNFAALGFGGFFTSDGVLSDWYTNMNQAPWTPPGWVFGAAWTTIMICFSFYMAYLWDQVSNKKTLVILFILQWLLNFSWNPVFFYYHQILIALILITSLTCLIDYFLFAYRPQLKSKSLLILPYFLWLLIATSLNAYIFLYN